MNKNLVKNILVIIILILIIIGAGVSLVNLGIITTEIPKTNSELYKTTLIIDYGNNNIDTYNIKFANATVFSVLMQASKEYNFPVETQYYEQYQSHFIISINNVGGGDNNKYWQYYLNGNYGTISSDFKYIKNYDTITWKFE